MERFTGFTLVDITPTGVTRGNTKERHQQANWETVLQLISLGAQPINISGPVGVGLVNYQLQVFGDIHYKNHESLRAWCWQFDVEHEGVFSSSDDPVSGLYEYFNNVPFINGLDEDASFLLPVFCSYGSLKNVHFILDKIIDK